MSAALEHESGHREFKSVPEKDICNFTDMVAAESSGVACRAPAPRRRILGNVIHMLNVGAVICGFHVDSLTELPDVEGRLWRMTYEKNGAELAWLERKDEVKTFVIAFKTLPEDDTGVAHIIEHSVLSGSEKYPVKSPFDEMRKSSLRVFMNAMTSRDKTYYPFSSRNDRDFMNLADVYLDAVFHPNAIKSPLALKQEGWHYIMDQKTGALSYNGVVYNEMRGIFADPERTAGRDVLGYLYPDTVYGRDSGGKPDAIPHLTHENFCAFYRKYYHPSNSRIFLDGSVDLHAILAKLDSVLKDFDRAEPIPPIPVQSPTSCRKTIQYASADCKRRTILSDAWSVGNIRDSLRIAAIDVLIEYLAGSNEAPLKKALLSRNLCEDMYMNLYDYQQVPLVMIVRNTTDAQADECRAVFRRTLEELLKSGLDRTRLLAIIDRSEFSEREVNSPRPRGLVYFGRAIMHWLNGGDPAAAFNITGLYKELRQGVASGLFEACIREMILENRHHVELTFSPSMERGDEERKMKAEGLARLRASMSESDVKALEREIAEVSAYQKREDTKEAKAAIPAVRVSDISRSMRIVEHSIGEEGGIVTVKTKPTRPGIVYMSAFFPIDGLAEQELVKVPLLASLHGKLATSRHDALSLRTEMQANVGRMRFYAIVSERGNYLRVDLAALAEKDVTAVGLLKEVMHDTRFDDVASMGKILKQKLIDIERGVTTHGDGIAKHYAARTLSRRWASQDCLYGYAQLRWLQGASADQALARQYEELSRRIFVRNGMVLSYTDNISAEALGMLRELSAPSDGKMLCAAPIRPSGDDICGIRIDGDTGYSGIAATLPEGTFNGAMRVAAKILTLGPLHKQIRAMGGAYGTAVGIHNTGLILGLTYRDPTPLASVEKIRKCGDALKTFVESDDNLDKYIVATIAGMDPYLSPAAEAARPVELYFAKLTPADEELTRKQVLETSRQDLDRIAAMLQDVMPHLHSFVVGGENQLKGLPSSKVSPLGRR